MNEVTGLRADITYDEYQKAYDWFADIYASGSVGTTFYKNSQNRLMEGCGPCHAYIQPTLVKTNTFKFFGSGMDYPACRYNHYEHSVNWMGYQQGVNEYYNFITSRDSPWWKLHQGDIEYLKSRDGRYIGYLMSGVGVEKENRPFLMNWMIATRLSRDHAVYCQRFADLVKYTKIDPCNALLLAPTLFTTDGKTWNIDRNWDGGHEPLNDVTGDWRHIDIARFKKGEYDNKLGSVNYTSFGWNMNSTSEEMKTGTCGIKAKLRTKYSVKTKFSSVPVINTDGVLAFVKEYMS